VTLIATAAERARRSTPVRGDHDDQRHHRHHHREHDELGDQRHRHHPRARRPPVRNGWWRQLGRVVGRVFADRSAKSFGRAPRPTLPPPRSTPGIATATITATELQVRHHREHDELGDRQRGRAWDAGLPWTCWEPQGSDKGKAKPSPAP